MFGFFLNQPQEVSSNRHVQEDQRDLLTQHVMQLDGPRPPLHVKPLQLLQDVIRRTVPEAPPPRAERMKRPLRESRSLPRVN